MIDLRQLRHLHNLNDYKPYKPQQAIGWIIDAIIHHTDVTLIHKYNDSMSVTGWLELYCLYIGKFPVFSYYTVEFPIEICESYGCLYVMYMNIMQA